MVNETHLLDRLTVEEKVQLLSTVDWWRTPVVKRYDVFIPHISTFLMSDGPNGARGESYEPPFDVDRVHQLGEEIAKIGKCAFGSSVLHEYHQFSPRGRNYKTYSEDPYVIATLAAAFVNDPWCLMTSYNKVNGEYCADSHRLIEEILRKEWGFSGVVVSDWLGVYSTAKAVNSGLDLEMPGPTRWRGPKLLKD
ncbi:Beta-glucosidase [Tolypocladium paradoxum]|uniref:beta-glucosidase n=1 Tax=Tolypocladium paradoxum TaxID=94208 RepID=A0A2S4L5N4_9HYPO|nr:Beta-glucosidase [Tolypocladium paradoxum]